MRRLCVQVASGLLISSLAAGCDQDFVEPLPKAPVSGIESPAISLPQRDGQQATTVSAAKAVNRAIAPRKDSVPIVVKVEYHRSRGACVRLEDGSLAMPVMDSFKVVEVVQGRLKANIIDVRPFAPTGSGYPRNLEEGHRLAIRLTLSDESWKQAQENEQEGHRWLIINGDEVEQASIP